MVEEPFVSHSSGHVGPRGGAGRYFAWTAFGLAALLLGLYRLFLLERADPCLGPWFVFCGCLVFISTWNSFRRTVIWFEWTGETLHYRTASHSTIRELPISELIDLEPLVRLRRSVPFGFAILRRRGGRLHVEYDIAGHAMRLERALESRLKDEGPKG